MPRNNKIHKRIMLAQSKNSHHIHNYLKILEKFTARYFAYLFFLSTFALLFSEGEVWKDG